MEIFLVFSALVIGFLVAGLIKMEASHARERRKERAPEPEEASTNEKLKPCPLCHSILQRGQRVHSVLYQTQTPDKIMEIWGCPFCSPKQEGARGLKPRLCPVCKKTLAPEVPLSARVFVKKDGRQHVHVLGCPACRKFNR